MAFPARVSPVTLGVRDVVRSTEFYEALGWPLSTASVAGDVSFFRTYGGVLAVWGDIDLAEDANPTPPPGGGVPAFRGSALAINLDSRDDVDGFLALAVSTAARLTRPAQITDWVAITVTSPDPDGHLWEVAHNPGWPIGEDGRPVLP